MPARQLLRLIEIEDDLGQHDLQGFVDEDIVEWNRTHASVRDAVHRWDLLAQRNPARIKLHSSRMLAAVMLPPVVAFGERWDECEHEGDPSRLTREGAAAR